MKALKLKELKKNYTSKEISIFNIHTNRVESYRGFDFRQILKDFFGEEWNQSFAYVLVASERYEAHIETYKFEQREPVLAFERSDQKSFATILNYGDRIVPLGPLHLVWKEKYKKKSKNYAAPRKHHWPYKVVGVKQIRYLPEDLLPNNAVAENVWGFKNYFKQCIHCHKIKGIGGNKSMDLSRNTKWREKGKKWLFQYIDDPKKLNPKSKMGVFPLKIDLREKRINDIVSYLYDITDPKAKPEALRKQRRSKSQDLQKLLDQNNLR